jgi:cyanophycinase-like exopeptidase
VARTFLLLGSGEFEPWTHDVESRALADATGDGSVVILPTASATESDAVFDRWGRMGLDHYAEVDLRAEVLPVKRREDAFREELAERVGGASLVYFSGGKPQHLANVLRDTPLLDAILRAMDRGAVWVGCSAGAMVVSRSRDGARGSSWLFGLGLIPHASFGVHWDRAAKIPGLAWWMTSRLPDATSFVGIDERTAILGDAERWEVFGRGGVDVREPGRRETFGAGQRFITPG